MQTNNIPPSASRTYAMLENAQHVITCPSCSVLLRYGSPEHINHEHRTDYTSASYIRVTTTSPSPTTYETQPPLMYHVYDTKNPTLIYATIEYIPANSDDTLAPFYKGSSYRATYNDRILFGNTLADILHAIERASIDTQHNLIINNWGH